MRSFALSVVIMRFSAVLLAVLALPGAQGFAFTNARPRRSALMMNVEETAGEKNIKVGVIGCGRIGLVHLGAITKAPNVTPVIVSNPTISKAEKGVYDV